MNNKTKIVLIILCLVIAFMDISGLPGAILKITVADVDAYIIPLMINFILIGVIAITVLKIFNINSRLARESWRGIRVCIADILPIRITAHPRGAYIRWGIETRH